MGQMRFQVFPVKSITEGMVQQAYLAGVDRVSWPTRTNLENECLVLQRSVSDSANLHIPWPVEGHGQIMLTTGSLMERPEPYQLPLELARGVIAQLRNQLSEWQMIGLTVSEAIAGKITEAVQQFSQAVVTQNELAVSSRWACGALRAALDAANLLSAAYAEQAWAVRCHNGGPLNSFVGADLGTSLLDDNSAKQFLLSFNAAQVPICWRDTEATEENLSWTTSDQQITWCRSHGLKVLAGPLLMLAPQALPDWLCLFDDDFESLFHCVSAFVRAAVSRYRGAVNGWICAGRVNTTEALALSEQEELQLVARSVELIHTLDPGTPVIVSFDQPWAEYMSRRCSDFPPLHFADVLARANIGLSEVMMEVNLGYYPGGTLPRHPLEFSRQLDMWSLLGMPMWLSISVPSDFHNDPLAQHKVALLPGSWTAESQREWVAQFVPLMLAKPMVQGVVWNQLRDGVPHEFPHAGLFDDRQQAKPALQALASLRQNLLKQES
jgi:hypothetical protein